MATSNDPTAQWAGETNADYALRLQQLNPPSSGPNQAMAAGWVALIVTPPAAPSGFTIK